MTKDEYSRAMARVSLLVSRDRYAEASGAAEMLVRLLAEAAAAQVPGADETARWVRAARDYADLSLSDLARAAGCTTANLRHWESGAHLPSTALAKRISTVTDFPVAFGLRTSDDRPSAPPGDRTMTAP